jgi:aspartyl-tRNA(Asn)/glutamyl-tRNA(Gln) amidotransferase subunit C
MLSKKQVEHIAYLARLKLTEKEKEKFSKELSQILNFVKKLNEVDTEKVEPFVFEKIKNVLREDKIKKYEEFKKLIDQAPEKEGNFIKIKKVF